MMDEDAARRILADLERQDEERKAEEIKKEVDSVKAPGQVVDVPAPREERRPDNARFASEHDTTVDKRNQALRQVRSGKARQGDAAGNGGESKKLAPPPSSVRAQSVATAGDARAASEQGPRAEPHPGRAAAAGRRGEWRARVEEPPRRPMASPAWAGPAQQAAPRQPPAFEAGAVADAVAGAAGARRRLGHAGLPQGHRRRRGDGAQLEEVALCLVLQSREEAGRRNTGTPPRSTAAAIPPAPSTATPTASPWSACT